MHAVCHDFGSLAAVRFLLGFIEVCVAPASIYITSSWYTKEEQVTRVAIWYTTSGWAAVFGGFFSFCMNQSSSFKWQGLFVLYGGLTALVGVFCLFWLAVSPTDASWLTKEEKIIALERVRGNKSGTEVEKFSMPQLKEAFMDIRFYMIFLLLVGTGLPNGGLTAFGMFHRLFDSQLLILSRANNHLQLWVHSQPVDAFEHGHRGFSSRWNLSCPLHSQEDQPHHRWTMESRLGFYRHDYDVGHPRI